jgi:hypothetical protein
MAFCPAATATAAIFTALVVLDIVNKNYNTIGLHISGGVFSVIGIFVICNALGDLAGWSLLAIPFVVLLIGFLMLWVDGRKDSVESEFDTSRLCNSCSTMPCRCGSWARPLPLPPPPPPCKASSQTVLPPSVITVPTRPLQSDIGCPRK